MKSHVFLTNKDKYKSSNRREENNLTTKGKGVPQNKVDEHQFDVQEKIETICKGCERW